ncbi:dTDP-4-dehydrorhamnose 3,5-epimerase family protein [Ferrovibrio sp.]|uniref:dTDP-4-dehydrorhamnose 3,5-epimerase family protein n=1 Tax=Ferrovibrio sp. TaxID=1917215 RepID=UPI0035B0784E
MFQIAPPVLPGCLLVRAPTLMLGEGWSSPIFSESHMGRIGIHDRFVEDWIHYAHKPGAVRGPRYQLAPASQAMLLRVLRGRIYFAAIDVRKASDTFGKVLQGDISYMGAEQLYVMPGFAVGWCSMEPAVEVLVKASTESNPDLERGINWCDPALGIKWPVRPAEAIVSTEDISQPMLVDQIDLL